MYRKSEKDMFGEFKLLIKKVSKELFLRTSDFILQETTKQYKNENTK